MHISQSKSIMEIILVSSVLMVITALVLAAYKLITENR